MVVQSIDQLKHDWTDKFVMVDGERPELARFADVVGQVKTVNMSGRALVEFSEYHLNIGWYDIDVEALKVVDKPEPQAAKPEGKKAPAKAAAKVPAAKAASPAAKAGDKPSVADILAAARAGKAPPKTPSGGKAASAAGQTATPAKAASTASKSAPAKVDRSKMSVADMLAAARAGGAAGAAPAEKAPAEAAPVEEAAVDPEAEPAPEVAAPATAPPAAKSTEKIDKSKMSIDEMCDWCRAHDAK
jgi:hypothetical protein